MYTIYKTRTETVSPRKAEEYLRSNTFLGQRKLDPSWVQNLVSCQKDGSFTKGAISLAETRESNDLVLMNGQHQLNACIMSGLPMLATIDWYKYENDQDLWHLFALFDTHKARSERHIMKAARGLFESEYLREIPLSILAACGSALVFVGGETTPNFSAKTIKKSDKADLVQTYQKDVLFVASMGFQRINVPVVCAMITTHRKDADRADTFWRRILHNDQLVRGTPEHRLHADLNDYYQKQRGGSGRNLRVYRLCVEWWNAHVTGTKRRFVRLRHANGNIKGVPAVES